MQKVLLEFWHALLKILKKKILKKRFSYKSTPMLDKVVIFVWINVFLHYVGT